MMKMFKVTYVQSSVVFELEAGTEEICSVNQQI
jgi:hypothetical protein